MVNTKAVIFDLYETLISEYSNGNRKVSRASRNYQELIGLSNDEFQKQWNYRHDSRMTGVFLDYYAVLKDIAEKHKLTYKENIIEDLYKERVHEKSVPFEQIADEIIEMLQALKKQGLKLALISNCTEEEVRSWTTSRLAGYFDEVIFSYQAGAAKPDAKIYELACSRLGNSAKDCIFVGDGGSNELEGASRVGMTAYHAVWFLPESISSKITTHKKLTKPSQLLEELRKITK